MTTPKLELSGARDGVRLLKSVSEDLNIPISKFYGWTDSTIVLGWLNQCRTSGNNSYLFRLDEIVYFLPHTHWRHVSS